jgi:aminoglycoside N3'-acetyltransferase
LNSFAAVGGRKYEICKDLGRSCYGRNSVFDRLLSVDAKMLFFGTSMYHMTLKHHMEHELGLPYAYHKAYFTPAYRDGKPLPLPFTACVRYLNGKVENNDCSAFRDHLEAKGMLMRAGIERTELLLVSMRKAFDEACDLLLEDPCYFLEKPYYETK